MAEEMALERDELAFKMICAWNNIEPGQAPATFTVFYNTVCADAWRRVAKAAENHIIEAAIATNKPAEVDLDALKKTHKEWLPSNKKEQDICNLGWNRCIDWLYKNGHLATGKGGDDKASSGFKLTGEHVRQIMSSPAYWREKDPAVMKMVQECFEYLTEKDRAEIKSLEQTEQQKTAEPCVDVKPYGDNEPCKYCGAHSDDLTIAYMAGQASQKPAATAQIDTVDKWEPLKISNGYQYPAQSGEYIVRMIDGAELRSQYDGRFFRRKDNWDKIIPDHEIVCFVCSTR